MWRYLFLIPTYLLSASLPLISPVGVNFEYEYALMAAYAALVLIPALALVLPARHIPVQADDRGTRYAPPFALDVLWVFLLSPVFGLAVGAWAFLAHYCPCSAPGFAFWMGVVWYPSWVLAHAIHHAILVGRVGGVARWQLGTTLAACYVALLVLAGYEIFLAPQKHLVNLLVAFWHGPIYDEWINVDLGLILARSAHLILAGFLLVLAWVRRSAVAYASLAVLAAGWIATGIMANGFPSVKNDKQALDSLLSARLEGTGFTLHYSPGESPSAAAPIQIERLFRDTEFQVGELTKILGGGQPLPHVQVYVYPDEDRKKLWFGAGGTDVTDVWTPSIHITAGAWPHPTLRHELVHALASGFSWHGIGFHPNMAITEGLAVALAPAAEALSIDQNAASIINSGQVKDPESLFNLFGFWSESGHRAYAVAGSLIRFMIAQHGIAGVKALYSGKSWETAFGESRAASVAAWKVHILKGYDPEKNALFTEALYRYPGVLNDLCPHSKADLSRGRGDSAFTRMRQPIGWDPDQDYLGWLTRLEPQDQDTRLRIWRREIRRIAQDRFPALGRLATWREALGKARVFPPKAIEDVEMAITESDVARALGDVDGSVKILEALQAEEQKRFFGEGLRREIAARLALEKSPAPLPDPGAGEWRRYLANWRKIPDGDVHSGPWLLAYLKLRNERDVRLNQGDLSRMLHEMPPDPALPPTFAHEWYKLLGHRLMRLGDFAEAGAAFTKAAAAASEGTREVFEEHARRAAFYATLGPLKSAGTGEDGDKPSH